MREMFLEERNESWKNHPLVPSWVDPREVGVDAFYTRPEIARQCHDLLLGHMRDDGAQHEMYRFIEPAAGTGSFYDLLPIDRRIGIDIVPHRLEFVIGDFLSWDPPTNGRPNVIVGNPPFGYRGWLALAFMNRAAEFADYVGLILPMSFQSEGKGSPKLRVRGLRHVLTEYLPPNAFTDDQERPVKINALFQVWQRGVNNLGTAPSCDSWLDLFTVDSRKERLCGQKRLAEADFFLQRTFFNDPPNLVRSFSDVRYVCGYGLVLKRDKEAVEAVLRSADWRRYSNLAAHSARHISMYHIRRALTDAGYCDD